MTTLISKIRCLNTTHSPQLHAGQIGWSTSGTDCPGFHNNYITLAPWQNWIYFSLYQYTSALHFSIISSSLFLTFGGVHHIFTSCFIKFSAADIDEKALSITV